MATSKIRKARTRRACADDTNHVVVGEVLKENSLYLRMRCRALHFKRPTMNANIATSEIKVRIFPWEEISYITELPESSDWERELLDWTRRETLSSSLRPAWLVPVATR